MNIPQERQKLIYSGRVLKSASLRFILAAFLIPRDEETVENYGIQNGQTVHCTRSPPSALLDFYRCPNSSSPDCCYWSIIWSNSPDKSIRSTTTTNSLEPCFWSRRLQSICRTYRRKICWTSSLAQHLHVWTGSYPLHF